MLVGEGRRLKAITLFPSMPNISLFVFRQSQQFGLSFSALKLRFSQIHQHFAKDVTFKKFYKFITDQWIMCSVDKLLYNFKADITSLYVGTKGILFGLLHYKDLYIYLLHDVAGFLKIVNSMHSIYHLTT